MSETLNNLVNGVVNGTNGANGANGANGDNGTNDKKEVVKKENKTKRMLFWGIVIVVTVIVLYVLFSDNNQKVRLATEVRNLFPSVTGTDNSKLVATASPLSVNEQSTSEVREQLANLFRSYL